MCTESSVTLLDNCVINIFQICGDLLARWGYDSRDSIEYVYILKPNTGDKSSCLRISIYDGQEVKDKLISFLTELSKSGAMYTDPLTPIVKLARFGDRDMHEDKDTATRNTATDPDFKIGGVNGRYIIDPQLRQYQLWLLNPAPERSYSKYNAWYGPAVRLSVHGMASLIECITQSTEEIRKARQK